MNLGEMTERKVAVPAAQLRPAFAAFYHQRYGAIARALAASVGDPDLGREAADEAMARCFANWAVVHRYDNPSGWVYRVGLNWARSVQRRRKRRESLTSIEPVGPPAPADPAIQRALENLELGLRSVVVCRYLLDWSTNETAEALGIRPGTVKSRLHRALAVLEKELSQLDQGAQS